MLKYSRFYSFIKFILASNWAMIQVYVNLLRNTWGGYIVYATQPQNDDGLISEKLNFHYSPTSMTDCHLQKKIILKMYCIRFRCKIFLISARNLAAQITSEKLTRKKIRYRPPKRLLGVIMWCWNIHVFIVLLSLFLGQIEQWFKFTWIYCEAREVATLFTQTKPQNEAGTVYSFGAQSPLLS